MERKKKSSSLPAGPWYVTYVGYSLLSSSSLLLSRPRARARYCQNLGCLPRTDIRHCLSVRLSTLTLERTLVCALGNPERVGTALSDLGLSQIRFCLAEPVPRSTVPPLSHLPPVLSVFRALKTSIGPRGSAFITCCLPRTTSPRTPLNPGTPRSFRTSDTTYMQRENTGGSVGAFRSIKKR